VTRQSYFKTLLAFTLLAVCVAACAPKRGPVKVTILHTNDVRGYTNPCG